MDEQETAKALQYLQAVLRHDPVCGDGYCHYCDADLPPAEPRPRHAEGCLWTAMHQFLARLGLLPLACLVLLVMGCTKTLPPPPAPAMPEDLSTWSVPLLVPATPARAVPPERQPSANERVYPWAEGHDYYVEVGLGYPLDLILEPGEQIHNIVGGDRTPRDAQEVPPWEVKEGTEGTGPEIRPHVFVSATVSGLSLGVIITTNKRAYYLTLQSVKKTGIRAVRWRYPQASVPQIATASLLPHGAQRFHVGYQIFTSDPPPTFTPRQILDDGRKTYFLFPPVALFSEAPMIRLLGPNGPQLVNARQYANVIILDQLVNSAELRLGAGDKAETVTIRRGQLRTITCPGDVACPVWPSEPEGIYGQRHVQ